MSSKAELSVGAIPRILAGEKVNSPIIQILSIKSIVSDGSQCLRLLITDGQHMSSNAMLASQFNAIYGDGTSLEKAIIKINNYIFVDINSNADVKRFLVIMDMTVLNAGDQISDPKTPPRLELDIPSPSKRLKHNDEGSSSSNSNRCANNTINGPSNMDLIQSIANLRPGKTNCRIKARVSYKSHKYLFNSGKGELFDVHLLDASGEIRAVIFNEQCEKFYHLMVPDKVYCIWKYKVIPANSTYALNSEFEITFSNYTVVEACDDEFGIPMIKYNFIPLSEVDNLQPGTVVDCVGICRNVEDVQTCNRTMNGKVYKIPNRNLCIVDSSNTSITVTLWEDEAVNFTDHLLYPTIIIKGAKVKEYKGHKTLSCSAFVKLNHNIPETHKLRRWFDSGNGLNISKHISQRSFDWSTLHDARNLLNDNKCIYFRCKAVIESINCDKPYYKMCPRPGYYHKINEEIDGTYACSKCKEIFENFKYGLALKMNISDFKSKEKVTCFTNVAEKLLNRSAQEIAEVLQNNPTDAEQIFGPLEFRPYQFELRAKFTTYNDVKKMDLIVESFTTINYREYNKYLIDNLKKLIYRT